MKPVARRSELEEQRVDHELVVYDLRTDRAHCLNPLTARVRELADGARNEEQIYHALKEDFGPELDVDSVRTALDALAEADLLEGASASPEGHQVSRRRVIGGIAAATALGAAPFLIKSIIAPTPAQAQSETNGGIPT